MRVDPPLKIENIFFAFLDELDHSTHFKNCLEIYLGLAPSPPTGLEISKHFFFFLLCTLPLLLLLFSLLLRGEKGLTWQGKMWWKYVKVTWSGPSCARET